MIRVLAVEDSRTQAAVLCAGLESEGFAVSLATSGDEALGMLDQQRFDVVVSDVVMPGMTGYELCRKLKDDPRSRDIPVVLLTSLTDPLEVVNGLESGADNFIRKPYQLDQLVARLRGVVHNRERRGTANGTDGVHLTFLEREFDITADRQQILDLLVSTFEDLVVTSREIRAREQELGRAHADLRDQLHSVDLERSRLAAVVDSVPMPLFVIGGDGLVSHVSEATAQTFATTTDRIRDHALDEVARFIDSDGNPVPRTVLPHHVAIADGRAASAGGAFDVFLTRQDGTRVPVVLQASPVWDTDGMPAGCVGTAHVLGALTQHDPVTGLPNIAAFLDRAASMLESSHGGSALLLLELDRFDVTRTALTAAAVNQVLAEIVRRLRQVFDSTSGLASPSECFLASLGGNQFGVVLANQPGSSIALHLADKARRLIAQHIPGQAGVRITASVGVALGSEAHEGPQLFAAAGDALGRAREAGGDRIELFNRAASQEAMERLELEIELGAAIAAGDIDVHYQPEVDL
ncbi:MAG TPA: response regulator, partial [Nocardioides sp.]|nr:response regulator [Nocardioides sp.]